MTARQLAQLLLSLPQPDRPVVIHDFEYGTDRVVYRQVIAAEQRFLHVLDSNKAEPVILLVLP